MKPARCRLLRAVTCGLFFLCAVVTANAQFRASVQGTVTDASGALVPEATVTLTSKETGRTQAAQTSGEGFYRLSELSPGSYTLSVEKAGFKKSTIDNLAIKAESVQGLDLVLTTGEVTESVTVTSEGEAALETENANINKAITTQEIRRLPQFGRDPYELLRLTPGIFGDAARGGAGASPGLPNGTGPGGSATSIFQVENQPQITANGQRISANTFQIDGTSVNSLSHGGAAVVTPNQESVKAVSVMSSTYSAEDGRNSGAQIKVVSQNGTNDFHGSLFLKANDPRWNAFNKYGPGYNAAGPEKVNQRYKQFGGSIGGPLPLPHFGEGGRAVVGGRDKSFFFFSYEGLRSNSTGSLVTRVETPEFRSQIQQLRPNSIVSRIFGSAGIAPRVVSVLPQNCADFNNDPTRCRVVGGGLDIGSPAGATGQYISFGNLMGGGFDGVPDIQRVLVALPTRVNANQYNLRTDFKPTQNDQLTLSYYLTKNDRTSPDAGSGGRPGSDIRQKPTNTAAMITYVKTLSNTMVNEARFNFTRFAYDEVQSATDTNFGIPRIEIENLPFDRIRFGAPQAETTPGIFSENQMEFRDVLNWVHGNMAWKFGGERRWEHNNDNLNGGSRPLFTFAGLFNFANDTPLFYQINADPRTGGPADARRQFRTNYYGLFAQNDWKFRPNVTLNLGLRWEYFSPLAEKEGRLSNIVFGSNGLSNSRISVVDKLSNPDRNNFSPRLGFAYSPNLGNSFGGLLKENRSVLRGGFGISYDRTPNVLFSNSRGNPPFFARYQICCGTSASDFSTPFNGGQILYALGGSNSPFSYPANPALAVGIDPATGSPAGRSVEIYGAQANTPNAYVYTYSLEGQYNLGGNYVADIGYQGSSSHKLVRLVNQNFLYPNNPAFFAVYIPHSDVNANYNGMNATLRRRFANGYQFDVYYRWAKSIDTLSNEGPGAETNQTFPQDLHTERGPSDYDVTHSITTSGLWDLPFFRHSKKALGGWQLSGIMTWHTGFPWTPKTGQCVSTPGGPALCPSRPLGYFGGANTDTSNDAFIAGIFPGNGAPVTNPDGTVTTRYFVLSDPRNPGRIPGIGRNSFRGPHYFSVDMTVGKKTMLGFLNEGASLDLRANLFNAFNNLNLTPFRFGTPTNPVIEDPHFGQSERGLAGRVIELQARFSF
ncbi:MAG TPA: TonB-dependent receptor [Pyrinomonadaceae bacterium]|nr:TonB-dependent receptor [Pyrinomonadaceae bacterium]